LTARRKGRNQKKKERPGGSREANPTERKGKESKEKKERGQAGEEGGGHEAEPAEIRGD